MIYLIKGDSSFENAYLICLKADIDVSTLLRRAKVRPGSYAGELIANLHDALFHRSLELKRDYTEYFSVEYATFGEYLRKRFHFTLELAKEINSQYLRSQRIIYFKIAYCFIEGDYGILFLKRILEPGGKT